MALARACALALALAAPAAASRSGGGACASDADCAYLGDCVASACVCDPGYAGATCAELDLAPAAPDAGLRQAASNSWCGTLAPAADANGTWHGFFSDMHGCGLTVWLSGSQVVHATAPAPQGPYTVRGVAVAPEAHNPSLVRAPDGTYLLFDSYGGPDAGCPATANYTTCKSGGMCAPKQVGPGSWTFHTAPSPAGPWSPHTAAIDWPCFSENITPAPRFLPNGTLAVVLHCDKGPTSAQCDLAMVTADDWRGPYVAANGGRPVWNRTAAMGSYGHPEDPFLWLRTSPRTGQVSWHIAMHNGPQGIHAVSLDGLAFTLANPVAADGAPQPPFLYGPNVTQTDGSTLAAARRERPWLLLSEADGNAGAPLALVTSFMPLGGNVSHTFTHVQPVAA